MLQTHEVTADSDEPARAAWAETVGGAVPYILSTAATVAREASTSPHGLATVDGRPVGVARIRDRVAVDGHADVLVAVLPGERGRGAGSALMAWAAQRAADLDAVRLTGVADEDGTSERVLEHWGFTLGAGSRMSWVDSRTVPADLAPVPAGLTLRPLAEVDPRAVWQCHQGAAPDDPSGYSRTMPFEEYVDKELGDPLLRHDVSRVLLDGEVCAAYSLIRAAGHRGWSSMTAVAPSHRGRGLSLVAKAAALRAAAVAGIHRCATANSSANTPVLALNERLGYQLLRTVRSVERTLARAGS